MTTSVAALYAAAGAPATTPAQDLVDAWSSDTQGFAAVFEDTDGSSPPSIYVKDTGTPANDTDINFDDDGIDALSSFFTYTAPSPKIVRQSDGNWKYCAHNLVLRSNDFSQNWTAYNASANGADSDAPTGFSTSSLVSSTGASGGQYYQNFASLQTGAQITAKARVKANGANFLQFRPNTSGSDTTNNPVWNISTGSLVNSPAFTGYVSSSIASLGSGWYLITVVYTAAANSRIGFTPQTDATTLVSGSQSCYNIAGAQLFYSPADETYIPTTTAARYALPISYNASGNAEGLSIESAATNLVTYSQDLTNAAWTKSNMTTALTASGPDGGTNTATTCTAAAANATALFSITSASAQRVTSVFIKRRTGTGNIDITQDNGSTWNTVAVDGTWTRFDISPVTSTNPTVGIRIVTSADAVDVAGFQHELGAVPTSPIKTLGATATRAIDDLNKATNALPLDSATGTLYVKYEPGAVGTLRDALRLDDGTANEVIAIGHSAAAAGQLRIVDGGAAQTAPLTSGTVVAASDNKISAGYAANDFAVSEGGASVSTDTSGTIPTVTTLDIGAVSGLIKEIMYLPEDLSDADHASLST